MWFKKKEREKESLPQLPELPKLPELPNLPNLPELSESNEMPEFYPQTTDSQFPKPKENIKEYQPSLHPISFKTPIEEIKPLVKEYRKEVEPIFVRIDKFEAASKNFNIIKEKILDIEKTLKGTKERIEKENAELGLWEQELESIKEKMFSIEKEIFSKIE